MLKKTDCVSFMWDSQIEDGIKIFSTLREKQLFTDCTLIPSLGIKYAKKAHKVILSGCSMHLKVILESSKNQHMLVPLPNISVQNLNYVLDFIYTGKINVPRCGMDSFLKAAHFLQLRGIVDLNYDGGVHKALSERSLLCQRSDSQRSLLLKSHKTNPAIQGNRMKSVAFSVNTQSKTDTSPLISVPSSSSLTTKSTASKTNKNPAACEETPLSPILRTDASTGSLETSEQMFTENEFLILDNEHDNITLLPDGDNIIYIVG